MIREVSRCPVAAYDMEALRSIVRPHDFEVIHATAELFLVFGVSPKERP